MSARFVQGFADLYDRANGDEFYATLPTDLPVLIIAGEQDPVGNFGEGAFHVANRLHTTGHADVRARVFPPASATRSTTSRKPAPTPSRRSPTSPPG